MCLNNRRNVADNPRKLWWLLTISCSMSFPISTIVAYWERYGLSLEDALLLQVLFGVAILVFEVPSGYAADVLGRKGTLVAGTLTSFAGTIAYALAYNFPTFLAAELLLGIGFSFISGADEALLFDSLAESERSREFKRVVGRINCAELVFGAVGAATGGMISAYNMRLPFIISAICMGIAAGVSLTLVEPQRRRLVPERGHFREFTRIARYCFLERRILRWALLFGGVLGAINQMAFWLYQPYLKECGVALQWNGWVTAACALWAAAISHYSHRFDGKQGIVRQHAVYCLLLTLSLFWMGTFTFAWSWLAFLLHQTIRGARGVLMAELVNHEVSEEFRATAISLRSFIERVLHMGALLIAREYLSHAGVLETATFFGWLVLGLGAIALLLRPRS